jgi:type 1 fimbriae regulatory protein FimB
MNLDISTLSTEQVSQLTGILAQLGAAPAAAKPKRKRRVDDTAAVKYLTEPELEAFFKAIDSPRDLALFRVIYHRGLRASEAGRLQITDLNLRDSRIRFTRLKGSIGGEYRLCRNEMNAIRKWLKVRGTQPGPLFGSRNGGGIGRKQLHVLMRHYGAAAGIPEDKRHVHALKHSCGTHLFNRGSSAEDVMDHLGHKQIANTLLYSKITSKRRDTFGVGNENW